MRAVVIGASGLVGGAAVRAGAEQGFEVVGASRSAPPEAVTRFAPWRPVDVSCPRQVEALLADARPDVVINCAFDRQDWGISVWGALEVARAARRCGARLVHVSTDAVFSPRAVPYCEHDLAQPDTAYGAAKAAAEAGLLAGVPTAAIVRTSLVVGSDGTSPRERQVHAAVRGESGMRFFTDDVRCPVALDDLVSALWEIGAGTTAGVHHVAGADAMSRHELACLIARRDGLDVTAVPEGRRSERNAPSVVKLDSTQTQRLLTTRLRGAREFLATSRAGD